MALASLCALVLAWATPGCHFQEGREEILLGAQVEDWVLFCPVGTLPTDGAGCLGSGHWHRLAEEEKPPALLECKPVSFPHYSAHFIPGIGC